MSPRIRTLCVMLLASLALTSICSAQDQTKSTKELAGWANTPDGQVWLRPGIDAYEHDTKLVRDTRTGQKTRPITPQSIPQPPQVVLTPVPQPVYTPQPVVVTPQPVYSPQPIVVTPQPVYSPQPVQPFYAPSCPNCPNGRNPYYSPYRYDVGPYGSLNGQNFGFSYEHSRPLNQTYSRIR